MVDSVDAYREFYNQYWRDLKPWSGYKIKRIIRILESLLQVRKRYNNPKLLDFGCGDGRMVSLWDSVLGGAHGFDLSDTAIEKAKSIFPELASRLYSGDGHKTPFDDNCFEIIIMQEVIEHTTVQDLMIAEIYRILKPGGTLILTTPNKDYFDKTKAGNYSQQALDNIISKKEVSRLLLQGKFSNIKMETIIFRPIDTGLHALLSGRFRAYLMKAGINVEKLYCRLGLGVHIYTVAQK